MKISYIDTMLGKAVDSFSNSVLSVIENVTSCFRYDHMRSSPTDTVHVDSSCKRWELPVCATVHVCCRFCGFGNHERNACPARRTVCDSCYSRGRYSSVWRNRNKLVRVYRLYLVHLLQRLFFETYV